MGIAAPQSYPAVGYNKWVMAYALIVTITLVFLCGYSVSSTRGTDQYWYIADTETLIRNQPPVTNFRFPGMLLREKTSDPVTHFVHNGPLLHINKHLATFLNISATRAWELSNIIWWITGSFFLFCVLRSVVSDDVALLGGLFYFATPIVAWQAGNFLQEIWLGFLASAFLYVNNYLKAAKANHWFLVPLIIIGAASHPFFILCSLYLIAASCVYRKGSMFVSSTLAALFLVIGFKNSIFPSSFPPDLKSIITSTIPGKTNLHWQFDNNPAAISVDLIISKVSEALEKQFLKLSIAPMTAVANIGMLALLMLLILRKHRLGELLYFTLFCIAAWWSMVVLLQNQPRYQLLILPALVTCIVILLDQLFKHKANILILVFSTSIFFVADTMLFAQLRKDTTAEVLRQALVDQALKIFPSSAKYLVIDQNRGLKKLVITELSPAPALMVDPRHIKEENLAEVISLFEPDYLITSMRKFPDTLYIEIEKEYELISESNPALTLTVYRVLDI